VTTPGPTAPAPLPIESPLQLSIAPVSPVEGASVPFNGDAALTVTNASAPDGRLVLITFQLATDPSFATPIATETIPQTPGSRTTCHIEASLSGSPVGTTLYWRARPGSSESIGAWTVPVRFAIGERQDAPDVLFADPPTLLSPADGSLQNRQPALVARAGSHSSGPTELRFYLSTTPSFSATPKCQTWLGNRRRRTLPALETAPARILAR
jgi:hypothetical protein